jgi:lipopolysaccharide export system permease protein
MKILDRFIGAEMVLPFFFGVAAFTSIFFAGQNLLKLTSQVLNGLPVSTAIELVVLNLPSVIVYTLPMSALLAVLIVFSRMSNDSEITALYASGVSIYRAIAPVVVLGLAVTALGFAMTEFVVPGSNRLSQDIQARVLKEEISTNKPFVVIDRSTNSTIYVRGGLDGKTRTMRDVTITRYNADVPILIFHAKEARWQGQSWRGQNDWILSDGSWYGLGSGGDSGSGTFNEWKTETVILGQTPEDIARSLRRPEEMSFGELRRQISDLSKGGVLPGQMRDFEVELYNKLAIPFAALVFAMIGAPLAVRPVRASTSVGVGLSILIIFAYWFIWHFSTALAIQGSIPPAAGAFLADVLGIILGIILLFRTAK